MNHAKREPVFEELSVAEKIRHVQDLWDRIAAEPDEVELTDAQREELDRRLAEHEAEPGDVVEWSVLRRRVGTEH